MYCEFNPLDYTVSSNYPVSNDIWIELNGKEKEFLITSKPFYVPTKNAKKCWPEKIKAVYGIEESIYYDCEISGLPNRVTEEMLEEKRKNYWKCLIDENGNPWPPPEKISPEDYLESEQMRIMASQSAEGLMEMFGKRGEKKELTEFEKKILQWRPGYGFLYEIGETEGVFFPRPKEIDSFKYEIVREYLFHLPKFPDLILSLAQEPNTDRAIWGFRRSLALDLPLECDFLAGEINHLTESLEKILIN